MLFYIIKDPAELAPLMLFNCLHEKQREIFPKIESISKLIAMIAITMRSSMRVKILIFTLEGRTDEQGTRK